jgi:hypothetical protein
VLLRATVGAVSPIVHYLAGIVILCANAAAVASCGRCVPFSLAVSELLLERHACRSVGMRWTLSAPALHASVPSLI